MWMQKAKKSDWKRVSEKVANWTRMWTQFYNWKMRSRWCQNSSPAIWRWTVTFLASQDQSWRRNLIVKSFPGGKKPIPLSTIRLSQNVRPANTVWHRKTTTEMCTWASGMEITRRDVGPRFSQTGNFPKVTGRTESKRAKAGTYMAQSGCTKAGFLVENTTAKAKRLIQMVGDTSVT